MIHFEEHALKNSLKVILAPMKETKAVTVMAFVGVGSRHEDARTNGAAHYLEHSVFKGTPSFPSTLLISQELDRLGAEYNAYTGEEVTAYYVRAASEHLAVAGKIVSEMFVKPTLPEKDVLREKGVIIEEINMYRDNPMSHVAELFQKSVMGDTPLGRSIAGSKKSMTAMAHKDVVDFHASHYVSGNAMVIVAGNFAKNALEIVSAQFGALPQGKKSIYAVVKPIAAGPHVTLETRPIDQAHFRLGVPSISRASDERYALKLLGTILGGGMSSRLFNEIREKRGLAYYAYAFGEGFHDTGYVGARAGVKTAKLAEAIKVSLGELEKLAAKDVSKEELKDAKDNSRGRIALGLEESFAVAQWIADTLLYHDRVIQPEEVNDKTDAVTAADVRALARTILSTKALHLAVIGPNKERDKLFSVLKQ